MYQFINAQLLNPTLLLSYVLISNAGVYIPAKISGFIWHDLNANGIQDYGEPGLQGISVSLYTDDDDFMGTVTVQSDGSFLFDGLRPGAYYGEIQPPSADYFISPIHQGSSGDKDSDFHPSTKTNSYVVIRSGENNDGFFDAGLYLLAFVGDYVWLDNNLDGIQAADEPGFPFPVTINLYDMNNQLLSTIQSNTTGYYIFEHLVPGSYEIEFILEEGDILSPQFRGNDEALDSDVHPRTKRAQVALMSGEINMNIDAGIIADAPYYPDWSKSHNIFHCRL